MYICIHLYIYIYIHINIHMFVCVHIYIYVHIFLHNIHGIGDRVVEQEEAVLHVKERERETHTESEPICKYNPNPNGMFIRISPPCCLVKGNGEGSRRWASTYTALKPHTVPMTKSALRTIRPVCIHTACSSRRPRRCGHRTHFQAIPTRGDGVNTLCMKQTLNTHECIPETKIA